MDDDTVNRLRASFYLLLTFAALLALIIGATYALSGLDIDPGVFIPASLAVAGSLVLYLWRQARRRRRIQVGIRTELKQLDSLESLPDDLEDMDGKPPNEEISSEKVPTPGEVPTRMFEENLNEISLLHEWVYEDLVKFYSVLLRHKSTLRDIHEGDAEISDQEDLYEDREYLKEERESLLRRL